MNDTEKHTIVIKILKNPKNPNMLNKCTVFIKETGVSSV